MRVSLSGLVRAADHTPAHSLQFQRVHQVFSDLLWLRMTRAVNLYDDFVVKEGEIDYVLEASEEVLCAVAFTKSGDSGLKG